MRLDEAKQHHLWRSLNDHEKRYLEVLAGNSADEIAAIKVAYNTTNEKSAAGILNRIHSRFAVSYLAQRLMGYNATADELRAEVLEHALLVMRHTRDEQRRVNMITMCAKLLGPSSKSQEPGIPQPNEAASVDVGDLSDFSE